MTERVIEQVINRHPSSLIATCEICGKRGGSGHVPYIVRYQAVYGSGKGGDEVYRCEKHKED